MRLRKDIRTSIQEGSWFVLYVVNTEYGFRCDIKIKETPQITGKLDSDRFERLGRHGTDVRKAPGGDWIFILTPHWYMTVSSAQAEEFFKAHDCVKDIFEEKL
jgi:hypothetical protein